MSKNAKKIASAEESAQHAFLRNMTISEEFMKWCQDQLGYFNVDCKFVFLICLKLKNKSSYFKNKTTFVYFKCIYRHLLIFCVKLKVVPKLKITLSIIWAIRNKPKILLNNFLLTEKVK